MSSIRNVCIIGGGFTGLAAATELLSAGVRVHLVEQNHKLGGMAGGFQEPGWLTSLEYTYHHWFSTDLDFRAYARKWGASGMLALKRPPSCVETRASGFVRLDSPASLLTYPDISFFNRLRMGCVLAYLRRTGQWQPLEQVAAADWCRRWMGTDAYEAVWKPQLISKFGAELEPAISMAFLWARLHDRSPDLGTVTGGFQALADMAEKYLLQSGAVLSKSVQDATVRQSHNGSWLAAINGEEHRFDAVIVAAPPRTLFRVASRHASGFAPEFLRQTCGTPHMGARTIILSLDRPMGKSYWYSLSPGRESGFTVAVEHTNLVPPDQFNGEHLVYFGKYLQPASHEWSWDHDVLQAKALECMARINPGIGAGNIKRRWVFDFEYAQPVRGLNASSRIPSLAVLPFKGLFHASLAHIYPWDRGASHALGLGSKTAAACLEYLESSK